MHNFLSKFSSNKHGERFSMTKAISTGRWTRNTQAQSEQIFYIIDSHITFYYVFDVSNIHIEQQHKHTDTRQKSVFHSFWG